VTANRGTVGLTEVPATAQKPWNAPLSGSTRILSTVLASAEASQIPCDPCTQAKKQRPVVVTK
jgi:hypothetical protein